jgi:CheY-like chemotaxis protein
MKVLLVDDHPLVLSALQQVIQRVGNNTTVVGVDSAAGARAALQKDADFDLVLLDLALGDADGFDVLVEFRAAYPAVPVVVVSASDRASDVIRAIDNGAMGFVPKRSSHGELHEALRMVMEGSMYVPPSMLGLDFGRQVHMAEHAGDTVPGVMRAPGEPVFTSTGSGSLGDAPRHRRQGRAAPEGAQARRRGPHAAPGRGAVAAAAGPAQQAHRAPAQPVGGNREGPRGRRAACPGRELAHAGRAGGEPDDAGAGRLLRLAPAAALSAARCKTFLP